MAGSALQYNLKSQDYLPAWWVSLYERISSVTSVSASEFNTKKYLTGVSPQFSSLELEMFPTILKELQQSLLAMEETNATLNLDAKKIFSKYARLSEARSKAIEKILFSLGSLKVQRRSDFGYKLCPVFKEEHWETSSNQNLSFSYSLSEGGEEFILGYKNPYTLWPQLLRDQSTSGFRLYDYETPKPLSVWRSLWLDLVGIEQVLLLRLEKKMQWNPLWLHMNGSFEISLLALFDQLSLPEMKQPISDFVVKLKILQRLGAKLEDHGYLGEDPLQYKAYTRNRTGIQLTWRSTEEKQRDLNSLDFEQRVAGYFAGKGLQDRNGHWVDFISAGLPLSQRQKELSKLFDKLAEVDLEAVMNEYVPVLLGGNSLLPVIQLFVEWYVRQIPGHRFPLPEDLLMSKAAKLASPASQSSIVKRFEDFAKEMSDNYFYRDQISQVSFASLVSRVTSQSPKFQKWVDEYSSTKGVMLKNTVAEVAVKPQLAYSESISEKIIKTTSTEVNTVQKNGKHLVELRKIAVKELQIMKKRSKEKYLNLQAAYFRSISEEERKILLEIKNRTTPVDFEKQLSSQLVKFMVENPSSWGDVRKQLK